MSNLAVAPSFDFRNDSGEIVPAFALVRITGSESRGVGEQLLIGAKPDGGGLNYVNGSAAVAIDAVGRCYLPSAPVFADYDQDSTPTNGEEWGPVNDSWELGASGSGFTIIGGATSGRVLVQESSPPVRIGFTDGALATRTGSLGPVATVLCDEYEIVDSALVYQDRQFTLTNPSADLECEEGTYVEVAKDARGNLVPVWVDCEPSAEKLRTQGSAGLQGQDGPFLFA